MFDKKIILLSCVLLGCQRSGLAPVDVKLDENGDVMEYGVDRASSPKTSSYARVDPVKETEQNGIYIVQSGDTLEIISQKTHTDPIELAQLNGLRSSEDLYVGQKLHLPNSHQTESEEKAIVPDDSSTEEELKKEELKKNEEKEREKKEDEEFNGELSSFLASSSAGAATTAATTPSEAPKAESSQESFQEKEISEENIDETTAKKIDEESSKKIAAPTAAEKAPVATSATSWVKPVDGRVVSKFGDVVDGDANDGIDVQAALGTPVKAASSGTVVFAGEGRGLDPGYGKTILINHGNDVVSSYTHLNDISVKNGAKVKAGDVIGTVGQTGSVSSPELHFEITEGEGAVSVNPSKYISF